MSFPNVADVLSEWSAPQQFQIVTKAAVDFELQETQAEGVTFPAILQPLPPQALRIKPEGQRTWKWWTMWTTTSLVLDDVIVDQEGKRYRVMSVQDWVSGGGGYKQYDLTEGP